MFFLKILKCEKIESKTFIIDAMTQMLAHLANNERVGLENDSAIPDSANVFDRDVQEKIAETIRSVFGF